MMAAGREGVVILTHVLRRIPNEVVEELCLRKELLETITPSFDLQRKPRRVNTFAKGGADLCEDRLDCFGPRFAKVQVHVVLGVVVVPHDGCESLRRAGTPWSVKFERNQRIRGAENVHPRQVPYAVHLDAPSVRQTRILPRRQLQLANLQNHFRFEFLLTLDVPVKPHHHFSVRRLQRQRGHADEVVRVQRVVVPNLQSELAAGAGELPSELPPIKDRAVVKYPQSTTLPLYPIFVAKELFLHPMPQVLHRRVQFRPAPIEHFHTNQRLRKNLTGAEDLKGPPPERQRRTLTREGERGTNPHLRNRDMSRVYANARELSHRVEQQTLAVLDG
mmetsp:Transcript_24058/g.66928  ORF Transcript_24058/g.66928 Transcript_24058/m.66928 type:complete len:333 (-) Transcript_24058:891-1889(-)